MKRWIVGTGAVASASVLILALSGAGSATTRSAASAGTTIKVDTQQTSLNANGNILTITDDYLQKGKKIGSDQIACITTGPGQLAECFATSTLPKGEIVGQGSVTIPPTSVPKNTVAITGGTGAYRLSRGTIDIVVTGTGKTGTDTFHTIG